MLLNWVLFAIFGILAYICISLFGQLTGGSSTTMWQAALAAIKPVPLLVLIIGNIFFSLGLFVGFKNTPFALPAFVALGIVVSFFYSMFVLGGTVTSVKVAGLGLILLGIYFLK